MHPGQVKGQSQIIAISNCTSASRMSGRGGDGGNTEALPSEHLLIHEELGELKSLQGRLRYALKYDNDGGQAPSLLTAEAFR